MTGGSTWNDECSGAGIGIGFPPGDPATSAPLAAAVAITAVIPAPPSTSLATGGPADRSAWP
nr:hypothetical protein GCM10020092_106600 [Actinoplanes digitatis]